QDTIRLPPWGIPRPHRQAFEFAAACRRDKRAILLELQRGVDADVFEIALHQLRGIDQVGARASCHMERRFEPVRETRLYQEALRIVRVILIVFGSRAELIDRQGPLLQAAGDRRALLTAAPDRLNEALPIDGLRDSAADPPVVDGRVSGADV